MKSAFCVKVPRAETDYRFVLKRYLTQSFTINTIFQ